MGRLLHLKKNAGFCASTAVEMDGHIMPGDLMQTEKTKRDAKDPVGREVVEVVEQFGLWA